MKLASFRRGSVLPAELPPVVWVDRWNLIAHTVSHGSHTDCWLPVTDTDPYASGDAWRYTGAWCVTCFTEPGRCNRRITDEYGIWSRMCHQPAGNGDTCLMHLREDITEDKRHERWAA